MNKWKTKEGTFLVQKNLAPIQFVSGGVGLKNGERFNKSAEYYEIDGSGNIIEKYGAPRSGSLEDELYVSGIHLVIGDSLYDFFWSQRYPEESTQRAKRLLYGLEPHESPLPFDADAAIHAYEQANKRPAPLSKDDPKPTASQSGQTAPRGVTLAPKDSHIPVGIPHRTLCDIEMLVYDYDAMGVKGEVLPEGSIFQPWEPELRRGSEVPITLGDQAAEFDWAVSSFEGHFLKWDDFFSRCRMIESESNDSDS